MSLLPARDSGEPLGDREVILRAWMTSIRYGLGFDCLFHTCREI